MFRFQENVTRALKTGHRPAGGMAASMQAWTSAGVDDPRRLAMDLEAATTDGTLVVLAADVVASERQVQAAVQVACRRWERGTSVARSLGAEVMRCLAGSHHVGEAIRAVGLTAGATSGWMIGIDVDDLNAHLAEHGLSPAQPHDLTLEGRERLGLPATGDGELLCIGLVAQADLIA